MPARRSSTNRLRLARGLALLGLAATLLVPAAKARAFPHVVKPGETLAQIAERTYGRVEMEQILVAANGLDAGSGIPIVPGMRLEVPAVGYRRALAGDTWAGLASALLGDPNRSDAFALANASMPWLAPADGQELIVPYNLRVVAGASDSLLTIAYRYLGERDKAWMLDRYNHKKEQPIRRGEVVLVPLSDLPLTAEGRAEAALAGATVRAEGTGQTREAQRKADAELPTLAADVRGGRYVEAIARGNRMLGYGELARPQIAAVNRLLTEAYAAMDAVGLAETACGAWRSADPQAPLDPVELSPKLLRACTAAAAAPIPSARPPTPEPSLPEPSLLIRATPAGRPSPTRGSP